MKCGNTRARKITLPVTRTSGKWFRQQIPTRFRRRGGGAVTWTDNAGNLWLFGGQVGTTFLNDLWFFNTGTKAWTYVSGGANSNGTYGTKGSASPANVPGSRWGATGKWDSSTNTVLLFGGFGYDGSSSTPGLLNDLWSFNGSEWTWVSGSSSTNQDGVYGTEGAASPSNFPGGRQAPVSWVDNSGNFWLFGGYNLSPTGQPNAFNDLWEFNGTNWAWMSGANFVNQTATYGTQGVAATPNVPGARWAAASWSDASGNLWLFGGQGFDAHGRRFSADLWEFKGGDWIWVKGSNSVSQPGLYGLQANPVVWPHVVDDPGSRWGAAYWVTKASGSTPLAFWMFGGEGFDSTTGPGNGQLNDLWRYLPFP